MQQIALDCISGLNYLECGIYSTAFAKSALEILKTFSDLGKSNLDPMLLKTVVDMGFSEQSVVQAARATYSSDLEKLMEYLVSNRDSAQLPTDEPIHINNLHCILINSLPAIPMLKVNVADILIKICNKPNAPHNEIACMLLLQIGILIQRTLGESCLFQAMKETVSIDLLDVPTTFDQLGSCIHVLSVVVNKSPETLEIVHSHKFTSHAICIMEAFKLDLEPAALRSLSPLFSLLDTLCKYSSDTDGRLMYALCNLINSHKNTQSPEQPDLHSLLQLLITLTLNPFHAKIFIDSKALNILLTLKVNDTEEKLKTNLTYYGVLLKQLVEDPYILQSSLEIVMLQAHNPNIEAKDLLKEFSQQILRSKDIFRIAFENCFTVTKKNGKFILEIKDRKDIISEKWKAVTIICLSLSEVFDGEQKGQEFMIPSHNLVSILADIFQSYPILIKEIASLSVKHGKKFITYLIRNIIPFRYSLQLLDGKVIFNLPGTKILVPPESYQNWVKMTSKLIKSLTFKQAYKQQNANIAEIYNNLLLDNNSPIQKARKKIFRELKDMLAEQSKKQ